MNWTQDDLKELKSAIAAGALVVQFKDKRVEFDSIDGMIKRKRLIESELGLTKPADSRRIATFSKGLH